MRVPSLISGFLLLLCLVLTLNAALHLQLSRTLTTSKADSNLNWATTHSRRQLQPRDHVVAGCKDRAQLCPAWAAAGECSNSSSLMRSACRATCGYCQPLLPEANVPRAVLMEPHDQSVSLNSGYSMPSIGFGTAGLGDGTGSAVSSALRAGYLLIDSAQAREWYREDLVGQAIADSGVRRDTLFLTSKLHPRDLAQASTKFSDSLRDLNTTYLDLFLLHYPRCWESLCGESGVEGTWQSAWRELEALVALGKIRSIGVSNFDIATLRQLLQMARITPSVVQSNSDILNANKELLSFCATAGVQFQGYSTLGTQWQMRGVGNPVLSHPTVLDIALKHNASAAHVALRWALQLGQAVIPRSRSAEHMVDNLAVAQAFSLSESDMKVLGVLDGTLRI